MSTKTGKDTIDELNKRIQAAREIFPFFKSPTNFEIKNTDGSIKYIGTIGKTDSCTCASHMYGQVYDPPGEKKGESRYEAEHGYSFQCKHIIAAKQTVGVEISQ